MPINENNLLHCVEIELGSPVTKSVIWLHGLGADSSDFVPIVPELHLPPTMGIRFLFPDAPVMPVTINNGYEMRAWFDIYGITLAAKIDNDGIQKSIVAINKLIEQEEARGVKSDNIILAGFSQGAVIALMAGLIYSKPLAGIIALSGYLPQADEVLAQASSANKQIPIFIAHGTEDPIVPYALGKATYAVLSQASYPLTWRSYAIPHTVSSQEIQDISHWMKQVSGIRKLAEGHN